MAETNKRIEYAGLFSNPATNNVVGQVYNDLLYSQTERIKEEQMAATAANALQKENYKSASTEEEAKRKILKDQFDAAAKESEQRKKEVSAAIKNINTPQNLLWGSYGYSLRGGANVLAQNMPEYIEKYGPDHMHLKTDEFNKILTEASEIYNESYDRGKKMLSEYNEPIKKDGYVGFIEGYNVDDYNSEVNSLNAPDRFRFDFINGEWQIKDNSDGSVLNGPQWIAKIKQEADGKFNSKPMRNFDLSVVKAFGDFKDFAGLEVRENMVKYVENELLKVNSKFRNTALNEYYVNYLKQNPEDADKINFTDFYSQSNNGDNKAFQALTNFSNEWMTMYDAKMKNRAKKSGGTGKSQDDLTPTIESYSLTSSLNTGSNILSVAANALTGVDIGAYGVPPDPASLGLKGVSILSSPIKMSSSDSDGWDAFKGLNIVGDDVEIRSLALGQEGDLFLTFSADFPVSYVEPDNYADLLEAAAVKPNVDLKPTEKISSKVISFADPAFNALIRTVGQKHVSGYTRTAATQIYNAFPDVKSQGTEGADFYIGLLTLSKATNDKFYNEVVKVAQEDGINVEEIKKILESQ